MDNRFEKCPDCDKETNEIGGYIFCDACKKAPFTGMENSAGIIREINTYVNKVEAWYTANKVSNFIQRCNDKQILSNSEKGMMDCIRTGQSLLVELKKWLATPRNFGDDRFRRLLYDVLLWDKEWQAVSIELGKWKTEES